MVNKKRGFLSIIVVAIACILIVGGYFAYGYFNSDIPLSPTVVLSETDALNASQAVLKALESRDYETLEQLVSSEGLSLSELPRLDLTGRDISKDEVSEIPKDTRVLLWGYTDGKGDPINLTVADFMKKYIYTHDYRNAPGVAVNKMLTTGGNCLNTIEKDVAGRAYVTYHFPGFNPDYEGMDWTSMYLVFDAVDGQYKLRAIAKDNWCI